MTRTYDRAPSTHTMDLWEDKLAELDGVVSYAPGRGVSVTVHVEARTAVDAITESAHVADIVGGDADALEVITEAEQDRRSKEATIPELMSAAEVADELGVTRQRVHQLRDLTTFPKPLADLRGGAVWDAAAIRKFNQEWERRPGRPRSGVAWYVTPTDDGRWQITKPGERQPSAHADTQVEAIDLARALVIDDGGGEMRVYTRSGHVRVAQTIAILRQRSNIGSTEQETIMAKNSPNSRDVVPNSAGGWDVKRPGSSKSSKHTDTQREAIDRARQIVKNTGGGEVRIHNKEGRIRDSDTIAPGNDPNPPRDKR